MSRTGRNSQQARAILVFGLVLGVVLALAGSYVVFADRAHRIDAATRKSQALAIGGQQLVWLQLRNIHRALLGLAEDVALASSAERPGKEVRASLGGVASRQPELQDVVLVDAEGRPLTPARGDPSLPRWLGPARGGMALAGLQRADGQWVLPVAVRLRDGGAVLARLRIAELQRLVGSLDTGREGRVRLLLPDGTVLADSRQPGNTGRRVPDLPGRSGATPRVIRARIDPLDGIPTITAVGPVPQYPLRVAVGVSRATVLAPWWRLVAASTVLYLLYAAGLWYLVGLVERMARARARLATQLQRSAEELRVAQRLGRVGTWVAERKASGDRLHWSEQVADILGLPPGQRDASLAELLERMPHDDRVRVSERLEHAWRSGEPFASEHRLLAADGVARWVQVRGARVPVDEATAGAGDTGRPRLSGTVVDITERMETQMRLADAEKLFRQLFEHNPLPFWVFDAETLRFLEVNQAALEQYGYSRDEFLGMTILDIRPPEQRDLVRQAAIDPAPRGEMIGARSWLHRRRDGSLLEVRVYAADVEFRGRRARLVLAEDVTDRMAHERELAWRAAHDMTTGLLNAGAFAEAVESGCADGCIVGYVQLRGVEPIEDSLGRKAGEDALRTVARRLESLGARFGAVGSIRTEEFALAVQPARWEEALTALQYELSRPVQGNDRPQRLEWWLGSAAYPEDGADALQVIGNAGLAAHLARAERQPHVRFQPEMAERATRRLHLASRVHHALERGEFELHYQLIHCVRDGRPAALEALLRWPQPQGGFIPPGDFIGICEDSGLIVPLGRWVLRAAADGQRRLRDAGFPELPVAVNVSSIQFLHGDLAADVGEAMHEFALGPGTLHVELTESVLMTQPERALETLQRLQRLGVCVSLDDFGTGFSSLSYLRHLPLDALKIDRSFVQDVDRDERNASICLALLALGRNLGLTVIAEGVENQAQFRWLREHGCDQAQGFGLERPAPLERAIERLAAMGRSAHALPWDSTA